MERRELLLQVVFGMQDRGTKVVQLTGQPGIGKSIFASQVGRYLLSMGHWTEAYWIDLSGISSQTAAGDSDLEISPTALQDFRSCMAWAWSMSQSI